ncbi:MAG: aspartate 1-decarboxylase [Bacteroidia bacterium]|nr:aspartate 1-decarboxylase [Bacteroidia bacterium]
MLIHVLKSKIHGLRVTQAEIDYIGSITLDEELMEAAGIIENEQVHVLNKNNGERLITYAIKGKRGSGIVCMNGPAALKVRPGDIVLVLAYGLIDEKESASHRPKLIFPNPETNRLENIE